MRKTRLIYYKIDYTDGRPCSAPVITESTGTLRTVAESLGFGSAEEYRERNGIRWFYDRQGDRELTIYFCD